MSVLELQALKVPEKEKGEALNPSNISVLIFRQQQQCNIR